MAQAVSQLTNLFSSDHKLANNGNFNGSTRASSTMPCFLRRTTHVRMTTSLSGLRGTNALDWMVGRTAQTLHSKVAIPILVHQRTLSPMTPPRAAMFEPLTEKSSIPSAKSELLTEKSNIAINLAREEARMLGHNYVGSEHILLGLIGEGTEIPAKLFQSMGITLEVARSVVEQLVGRGTDDICVVELPFTPIGKRILDRSLEEANEAKHLGHSYIGTEHLLLALLHECECVYGGMAGRDVLENMGVDISNSRKQVIKMVGENAKTVGAGTTTMTTLEEYGTNLTELAEEGKLDPPVVGLESVIELVTQILGRPEKNNACLVGELPLPGVVKTAIAEGLAQRIASGDVPKTLEGKQVISSLDMGRLVAGLKNFDDIILLTDDIILFIDEVRTLFGAGAAEGAIDAANILKPALARGEVQCIGATTRDEYRMYIENDQALETRFQPVTVPETTVESKGSKIMDNAVATSEPQKNFQRCCIKIKVRRKGTNLVMSVDVLELYKNKHLYDTQW